jgi:catechol 2,3-dioxygenase-like lactoylglutathione lyase family enzyme
MLADKQVLTTLAVHDVKVAARFYEGILGLHPIESMGDAAVVYKSGGAAILVYQSQYAGTNKATAATWNLGSDFDGVIAALQAKRVHFEHYDDLPRTTRHGDVHESGGRKLAWIRDPDGNILALATG